jgi:hypothetical protein
MTVLISIADIGFKVAETVFGKPARRLARPHSEPMLACDLTDANPDSHSKLPQNEIRFAVAATIKDPLLEEILARMLKDRKALCFTDTIFFEKTPNQFFNRFQTGIVSLVFGLRRKQITSGIAP